MKPLARSPTAPFRGFAPFNVQNIGGDLFVTYAYQDAAKHDDKAGAFHGFVDVFDTSGHLVRRFQHGAYDNSPWGLAVAPPNFGKYAGDLLVGNFGSGWIDVFNMTNGKFIDYLTQHQGSADSRERPVGLIPRHRLQHRQHQHALLHRRHQR